MKNQIFNRQKSIFLIIVSLFFMTLQAFANDDGDRFKMSADFRLRGEFNTNRDGDKPDRFRERIRFRSNAQYQINQYLTVHSRLATGNPGDPNSPHQTFGSMFHRVAFNVDRAYVQLKYKNLLYHGHQDDCQHRTVSG